jgi:endonuclease YncB( thermonuclease family)
LKLESFPKMPRTFPKRSSFIPLLILVVAICVWIFDAYRQANPGSLSGESMTGESGGERPAPPARTGHYETYPDCTLAADRRNDGDSFLVNLPGRKAEVLRLYFVDSPESAFKSYGGGRNNHERIADQAKDLGGITPQQAVAIGKKAKEFTLAHLGKAPFTVHTEWDSPFNDRRYHAFVEVSYSGKPRFLHELLVEKGYARIHTKGATMPDGTPERKQENHLYDLQRAAKSARAGAWGL